MAKAAQAYAGHVSGCTYFSDNKSGMTGGVTEEMVDSVHSLMPKKNYYEWKQDLGLHDKFELEEEQEEFPPVVEGR